MKGHPSTPNESEEASLLWHPLAEYVDLCFPKDVIDYRGKAKKDLRIGFKYRNCG